MALKVVQRATANTDWHIGYLNGAPAVGDDYRNWYIVTEDVVVQNRYDGYTWYIEDGEWRSTHNNNWHDDVPDSAEITMGGP